MNKKTNGHTLPELMIYMVLGIIVTGLALQAIGHIAKNYVHGREVTKMQQSGRDAINVVARDLANTGFKHVINRSVSGNPATATYTFSPRKASNDSLFLLGCYTGSKIVGATLPRDSLASFFHFNGENNASDTIEIFRANLTNNVTIGSISRITYKIVGSTLYRYSQTDNTVNNTLDWSPRDSVAILDSCKSIQFEFLPDGGNWTTGWITDPTGAKGPSGNNALNHTDRQRHLMKYIRISLLAKSDREGDGAGSGNIAVGDASVSRDDGNHLYRTYQVIVPIPNNGKVIF